MQWKKHQGNFVLFWVVGWDWPTGLICDATEGSDDDGEPAVFVLMHTQCPSGFSTENPVWWEMNS